ncbi:hypothetical protein TRFO_05949 [Tritrichomonas foetus]|uniref:Uncharacterized protein n=1 Tax=Tritrichomonas foetus TaxID=1144522 RepID=A0A1J4K6M8_9EUKA|nr:hypothetical protein TRFO_05949 [Tritrichomonas foetus]|eukprot:OHT05366.1 hypothetical protein TRFO_05949 [Tritrichomonas foetus]
MHFLIKNSKSAKSQNLEPKSMHHIAVQIKNDSNSDDSADDYAEYLYEDVGDREVFMQMWRGSSQTNGASSADTDESNPDSPLSSIHRAYQHIKAALSDVTTIHSMVQNVVSQNDLGMQKVQEPPPMINSPTTEDIIAERFTQLDQSSNFLLSSAASLREEVSNSQRYFRSLAELSQRFPLKLITDKNEQTQASVASSYPTSTSIVISEGQNGLQWSLSDSSRFSLDGKYFEFSDVPSNYLRCFFELMCHELFERIKNDKIKSAIHYSANKDIRSVYFDVGNRETRPWVFELGAEKDPNSHQNNNISPHNSDDSIQNQESSENSNTVNKVPVWIPRLIDLIMDPQAQPATFMRQLLFFKATLDSMTSAFCERFLNADFCTVYRKTAKCKAAFQIGSPYLYIPYIAFIDKWRVSMTETPNELRCIPYSTDGRGLTPALEKWCDASFSTLFLAMAERVTRSFGFVFKNKNQYGTATIGTKKIKFTPQPKSNDVEITITARNKKSIQWKSIPGTDHIVKMCVIIFQDFTS